jgi:hypothetical protein
VEALPIDVAHPTGILFAASSATAVSNPRIEMPRAFALRQNYPNPFNPVTRIDYEIAVPSTVHLVVYDLLGREIAVLVNGQRQAGTYTAEFNGSSFSSGIYFFRLRANQFVSMRKMILLK